jgi:uncharacterized membrane-anchored protein
VIARRWLVAIGAAAVLFAVDAAIVGKEAVKRNGTVVFVDIGPRDPRSLMQGDYMSLRFALAQQIEASWHAAGATAPREGEIRSAPVSLDPRGIARLAAPGTPAALAMRYRVRHGRAWLGTDAFFFAEGSDKRYAGARYGEFRVDPSSGEAVLVGLRDAKLQPL